MLVFRNVQASIIMIFFEIDIELWLENMCSNFVRYLKLFVVAKYWMRFIRPVLVVYQNDEKLYEKF